MSDTASTILYCKFCDNIGLRQETHEEFLKNGVEYICHLCKQMNWKSPSNQPERSKREDLSDLGHELTGIPLTEESWCIKCNEEAHVIEKLGMRCSEHDGNAVREAQ